MAIDKKIMVDGREVPFRVSAAVPRIYRMRFGRDLFKDMSLLESAIERSSEEASTLDAFSLEVFENLAYVMAKHADPDAPDTPEEWLDGFEIFSIYQILPELLSAWSENMRTDSRAKKN